MKMIRFQTFVIACAIGWSLPAATAQAAVDKHARNLTASCAACHGTNGHSVEGTAVLAGMDKKLFVATMKDFKSGARPATVMHHHAKGYSDEEYEKMAKYFAAQKR
jgi:cytochrome c553